MVYDKKNDFITYVSLSGAVSVVFYLGHVILGGLLWDGYSHLTQTISELTSDGAPNILLLRTFTTIYGILVVVFSQFLFWLMKKNNFHKLAKFGALSLVIMEMSSFFGYLLFPLILQVH